MKATAVVLLFIVAVAVAVDEECPQEQETDWTVEKLLRHEDCNKFYKCTHGVPVEQTCYGDLYFNLETWQCDWPHNVDCTGRVEPTTPAPSTTSTTTTSVPTTTSTTTTPASTTTSTTTTSAPTTTTTTPTPTTTTTTTTTTPAPTTTTTTTTTPEPTTTTTTTTTPVPTTTTTTTTTPVPTTTTTTTTPKPTTTTTTTTTPAPTTTTSAPIDPDFLPNGCPVNPHIHWLLPHENDCNKFYYCVWGEKVLRVCPSTLHFNPVLQVCDWPRDAGCATSFNKHYENRRFLLDTLAIVILFTAAVAVPLDDECPQEQEDDWTIEKLLRHEDCNKFYICTHGVKVEQTCYGDLYFNLETWQCDWPHNVDCTGRVEPTTPAPSTTSTTTTPAPTTTSTTTTSSPTTTTTTPAPTTITTTTTPVPTTTTTTTPKPTTTTTTTTTPVPTTTTTTTTTPVPTTTTTTTTTTTPKPTTTTTTTTTPKPTTTTTTTTTPKPTTTTTTTTTPAPTTTTTTTTTPVPTTTITTPKPTTTTTTTTTPVPTTTTTSAPTLPDFLPNGCPVNPHIHWLLPHENNCNKFYYCVWGEKVLRVCPSTLHFNPVLQVCDWPRDAGCAASLNKHRENRRLLLDSINF
ncbi:mucin-2-like [Melitaea cinxia]|uniref:mucin-2-like n=1 Tax=Melitaea cinxia TaxID=113334 RepID=UPI001E272434|nr:mucin-2-like [Melitaea cinxia]